MPRRDYTPIINGDRYCLMCRHVCPVERITKREATSPHGWALLIASVERRVIDWNADTVDTLYQCADCGLCQANCATDRPLPAAIVAGRAAVVEAGAAPVAVTAVAESLRRWGNPYGAISAPPADGAETGTPVGLFVGAATYTARPQAVAAAQALLRAAGYAPRLLSTGRAGVYLPYTLGLWEEARALAAETAEEIRAAGVAEVLTLSREDTHAFRHVYLEIGVALPGEVRVDEFTAWLAAALDDGRLQMAARAQPGLVYHDPCHTPRLPEAATASRALVRALTGAAPGELFWREKRAGPCGAIGGFSFTQPWLAAALARERIADARAAGAALLVTDDPQCAAHLAAHAGGLPVANLIELVAEQLTG